MIIYGEPLPGPGVHEVDYLSRPDVALRRGSYTRRTQPIHGIVLHTRMGIETDVVLPDGPNHRWDELVARRWYQSGRKAGAHLIIDADGSMATTCDLGTIAAYHAGQVNQYTIGIEIYQSANGDLYLPALQTAVASVEVLCDHLRIPRRFPAHSGILRQFARGGKRPWRRKRALSWMEGGESGAAWSGVYAHSNATRNRGVGDPGRQVFGMLEAVGFKPWTE